LYFGRVVGTVVASVVAEGLSGQKLLLVQPLDERKAPRGGIEVAVDTVRSGPAEIVFLVGSREAALALDQSFVPVDAAIVGIVGGAGFAWDGPEPKAEASNGGAGFACDGPEPKAEASNDAAGA